MRYSDHLLPLKGGDENHSIKRFDGRPTVYRKDTELLYHSFMYSLVSHSFRYISSTSNAFIACYIRRKKYYVEVIDQNVILLFNIKHG